jgi:hypothetical protein
MSIINLVTTVEKLTKCHIERIISYTDKTSLANNENLQESQIIFAVYPHLEKLEDILEYVFKVKSLNQRVKFSLIITGGESYEITNYLTVNTLIDYFTVYSFYPGLIPIDFDLLSLERKKSAKEIYIDKDLNSLTVMAKSIAKMELLFGKIKHKFIKGDNSCVLNDLLRQEEKSNAIENDIAKGAYSIYGLIVLERNVDFITPFCSNYTYEGILDDFFDINVGRIKVDKNILGMETKKGQKPDTIVQLSSKVLFYSKIRSMLFMSAYNYIIERVKKYKEVKENAKKLNQSAEIQAIKEGLQKYNKFIVEEKQPLDSHASISYYIRELQKDPEYNEIVREEQLLLAGDPSKTMVDIINNLIGNKKQLDKVLRLLCLVSVTQGGIEKYNLVKQDILNVYGYQKLFLMKNLEKMGLLKEKVVEMWKQNIFTYNYDKIKSDLKLLNTDFNGRIFEDCAYVLTGLCPITLRLVESAVKDGWKSSVDFLKKSPGKFVEPPRERISEGKKDKNFIFVVFLGGVTFAEIEGIRFLNLKYKEYKFIILTTEIISCRKLFSGLDEEFGAPLKMKDFYESSKILEEEKKKKKK